MELRALRVRLAAISVVTGFCVDGGGRHGGDSCRCGAPHNGSLGAILVSSSGRTLYHLSSEKEHDQVHRRVRHRVAAAPDRRRREADRAAGRDRDRCSGRSSAPTARSRSPTTGLPLYLYAGDKKAGDVKGQGVGRDLACDRAFRRDHHQGCQHVDVDRDRRRAPTRAQAPGPDRAPAAARAGSSGSSSGRQRRRRHLYAAGRLRHEPRRLRLHVAPTRASAVLAGRDDIVAPARLTSRRCASRGSRCGRRRRRCVRSASSPSSSRRS